MGVDFYYCGECKQCFSSECFPDCIHCGQPFEHPCKHGLYCIDCGKKKEIWIEPEEDRFFCNKECYKKYKEKRNEEIYKCSYCKKQKKYKKFQIYGKNHIFCDQKCCEKFDKDNKNKSELNR